MIKKFTLLFLLSVLTLTFPQTDSLNMRLLGMWALQDTSNHNQICRFAASEDYLFIFTEAAPRYDTVHIVDVGDPSHPHIVSKIGDFGGRIAIYGDFLYVGWDYLGIIDVSIPESPVVVYRGDMVYGLRTICPYSDGSGVYLVVTCDIDVGGRGEVGIRVIDVTDPSSPELLDWYYVPEEITDWYYVVHHNLASISVVYPHLFAFETIEYYDTSYWGGFEEGYVQVKMFDLRDLSAPPVVWRSERIATGTYESMVFISANAADGNVMISYVSHDDFVDILFYNDTGFTDLCELEGYLYWPLSAVNDTYYATRGRGVMAIKALSSCEIETLGYYTSDMWGREYVGIKFSDGRIYAGNRDYIYILEWLWDGVTEVEGGVKERYSIYPVPVEYGVSARLNKALDRQAGIYDISGKLRSVLRPGTREIDTRKLSPGVYFLISEDKKIKLKFVVI